MTEIQIPYNFEPREYQLPVFKARDRGCKRFVEVWHRRAGKDKTGINFMAREMIKRPGIYYYLLPTYAQGRKIIWEGRDKEGFPFLGHIPQELRKRTLHQEMMIELKEEFGGSIFRVIGVDKIDRVVGTNPVGIVYSEYSLMDPAAWRFFEPILMENDGWAYFDFTPRGRNHAYKIYEMARKTSSWHCSLMTVEDTGIVTPEQIQELREQGTPEEIIQQEYYCSFAAGMDGAVYASFVEKAREQKRIGDFPYNENSPVDTFWDIGLADHTAILFRQTQGGTKTFVHAHHDRQKSLAEYARYLKQTGYYFNRHVLPHDGARGNIQTGKTTADMLEEELRNHGVTGYVEVVPRQNVMDGIAAVRRRFGKYRFDAEGCGDIDSMENGADGDDKAFIPALMNYHMKWNAERQRYDKPVHDWSSHYCDALRTEAMSEDDEIGYDGTESGGYSPPKVVTEWNPFGG